MSDRSDLKALAQNMEPLMTIGKDGLSDGVLRELDSMLKAKRLIKVRFLKTALEDGDRKAFAAELAKRLNAQLVDVRGLTAVLHRV